MEVSGQLYPQGESPWYPLDRRVDGPYSRSGQGGEGEDSQPLPGLEPQVMKQNKNRDSSYYRSVFTSSESPLSCAGKRKMSLCLNIIS
jgi:hypothetical protein